MYHRALGFNRVFIQLQSNDFNIEESKGGFLSEKFGKNFHLPKNIPFFCFKFVHPIHDIDNMSIVKKSTFTGFIYVQVQKVGFTITTDNLICSQHLKH